MSMYVLKYTSKIIQNLQETIDKMGVFVLDILDRIGKNFPRSVNTRIEKVFIGKVPMRFYTKSEFCVCLEVHTCTIKTDSCKSTCDLMQCIVRNHGCNET